MCREPNGVQVENEDFGDYEYDIVPQGFAGFGDMAYSVEPALDKFGLGYGDMGAIAPGVLAPPPPPLHPRRRGRHPLSRNQWRALRRFRRSMRRASPTIRAQVMSGLRAKQRQIKAMGAFGLRGSRRGAYNLLVRKIKSLRRIMTRPIISAPPPPPPRTFAPIRPRLTPYTPIRPQVMPYAPIQPRQPAFSPIIPTTTAYAPIQPQVESYAPIAPMASTPEGQVSSVVRIRQSAPTPGSSAVVENQGIEYDEAMMAEAGEPGEEELAMESEAAGWGDMGAWIAIGKYGGVTAKIGTYKANRRKYFAARRDARKGSKSYRKSKLSLARIYYKRVKNIERKNASQIRVRRAKGKRPWKYQGELARYIKKVGKLKWTYKKPPAPPKPKRAPPPPPRPGAPPLPPKKGDSFAVWKMKMKRLGWRTPPADFLSKSKRGRHRWRMWNSKTSPLAIRLRKAYWARKRGIKPLVPGIRRWPVPRWRPRRVTQLPYYTAPRYIPAPRPIPQYQPITPYVPQYAPVRVPGPSFAPIRPSMTPYVPAPMPPQRPYVPVGTETPVSYTYTTAGRPQAMPPAMATPSAARAMEQSAVAAEQAEAAVGDEKEGMSLQTIGLAVGGVALAGYFLSQQKKKKGKKKAAKKKPTTTI